MLIGSAYNLNIKSKRIYLLYPLLVESNWKYILQKIQNRAGRVITGASYDIRSVDVLDNLKWKNLETRRSHIKDTIMQKILNDQSAPNLRASFTKLNNTNTNYNLETNLALPRPNTNFLKSSFKYNGAMLLNNFFSVRQKSKFFNLKMQTFKKANLPLCLLLDCSDSLIYICTYIF